ncbi:MAG: alternative ribosome rescue aminoacyl-tRNA hydrolase ArfB [Acidimicrobiia bacterium]
MTSDGIKVGSWVIPESELIERFETSGGPGGQHANKNETSVILRLDLEGSSLPPDAQSKLRERIGPVIEVTASDSRSQWRNRALARRRLAERIETALADNRPRQATKPSRRSRERRLEKKRLRSELKKSRSTPRIDD